MHTLIVTLMVPLTYTAAAEEQVTLMGSRRCPEEHRLNLILGHMDVIDAKPMCFCPLHAQKNLFLGYRKLASGSPYIREVRSPSLTDSTRERFHGPRLAQ